MEKILVFDTTLRDGEQTPGVVFSSEDKINIACKLDDIGVDFIELGSTLTSEGEEKSVKAVIKKFKEDNRKSQLECLCFIKKEAIDWAHLTGVHGVNLLVKGAQSQLKQLGMTPEQHAEKVEEIVNYALEKDIKVNIYLEHFFHSKWREDKNFVKEILEKVSGKAKRIHLCDTLGIWNSSPACSGMDEYIKELISNHPQFIFSIHCHNDFDIASSNTKRAVDLGCRCIDTTINGLGERAGNTPLNVVIQLHNWGYETNIKESELYNISKMVEKTSSIRVHHNEPFIGSHVFTHKAGVHVDGMEKGEMYQGIDPKRIGRSHNITLGKHSGRANIQHLLKGLGIEPQPEIIEKLLIKIKDLEKKKLDLGVDDVIFMIDEVMAVQSKKMFDVLNYNIKSSKDSMAKAYIEIEYKGMRHLEEGEGVGGFDAFSNALRKIFKSIGLEFPTLIDYNVTIPPGGGTNALTKIEIVWLFENRYYRTIGINSDQTAAGIEATINALNSIYRNLRNKEKN